MVCVGGELSMKATTQMKMLISKCLNLVTKIKIPFLMKKVSNFPYLGFPNLKHRILPRSYSKEMLKLENLFEVMKRLC